MEETAERWNRERCRAGKCGWSGGVRQTVRQNDGERAEGDREGGGEKSGKEGSEITWEKV